MFRKVTQSIVNEMDPTGDLVPVDSILDHEHFRPLCLVRRKRKAIFQPSPRYKQTWYRLNDVLLPEENAKSAEPLSPNGGSHDSRQFTVQKSTSDRVDGSLSLCVDSASVELTGSASSSKGWSIKLEKNYIPVPKLEALKTERKVNVNHSFIQQLKKTQQNLYIVHETIETSEEAICEESTNAKGSFMAQLYAKFFAKGTREKKQSITIPKGCTLAFRAIQLDITDQSWDLEYFPEERMMFLADGYSHGKLGALEAEVEANSQVLSNLSSNLSVPFLKAIKAAMRDRNLFQELTQKMEAVLDETGSCELTTESPDLKDLLSSLQYSSQHLLLSLAEAITYALDALDELTEDQLLLLLESLEEKIVSQQLKLVKSILEHDIEHGTRHFSVDASLLSFSRERDQKLTIALVEMSGVKLQKDGSAVCTEEAFSAAAALYTSLYVLDLQSNSD
ncbi:PREDICTED: gasdermin-A3-like [Chlamydotis macqueenii]|uniref:gasdermin-A3-like n=1 Tax=Chlamydotis macqueenii TaxID=187382 RepID=UPI000529D1FD|nr:PREDICTED: gasdermin-A3-like [Chlamydotis macqueenii]